MVKAALMASSRVGMEGGSGGVGSEGGGWRWDVEE